VPLLQRALVIEEQMLAPDYPRFGVTVFNLASVYDALGRYPEAEDLYRRVLSIWETNLGPEHENLAAALEKYATLLRKTDRKKDADKLEARAKVIRAKHAQENPEK
ncbi:MAG: tetratricopeptide repeat protein, partial [Candidatus Acidiferrales bacterium]